MARELSDRQNAESPQTKEKPLGGNRTRRAFSATVVVLAAGLGLPHGTALFADDAQRRVRIGMVTDLHYADKPATGSRHYRETLAKLDEAAKQLQQDQPDFVVELGDLIDSAGSIQAETQNVARINKEFSALPGDKHYVLGNHCVHTLTKDEFLGVVGQKNAHYSFNAGGLHFVVLDACFRSDGEPYGRGNFKWTDANIPEDQVEWLRADLKAATGKTIVFTHQRLDVKNDHGVKNAEQIRKVLEVSGKVLAVFQGHSHKNDLKDIGGIHSAPWWRWSRVRDGKQRLLDAGRVRLKHDSLAGFRKQSNYDWKNDASRNVPGRAIRCCLDRAGRRSAARSGG
jgi:alkaline phosphatase